MKRERGWFQIGTGLGLFLLCVVALAGCVKVIVHTAPSEASSFTRENGDDPPMGLSCPVLDSSHCGRLSNSDCSCKKK